MDMDLGVQQSYVIVKGYIDAKDDRGRTTFGTLLALVSRRDLRHLSVMFTRGEIPKTMDWKDFVNLHEEKERSFDRDPLMVHHEEELYKYLDMSAVLNGIAKNHNTKQAEQAISRYCMEKLQLKAVTFIDFTEASDSDMEFFEALDKKEAAEETVQLEEAAEGQEPILEETDGTVQSDDIFVRCDPILDPIYGVAMNELNLGDRVYAQLPEDSVFYKLLTKNLQDFDGVITAQVTGILVNELGTATISLNLSDGVSGVMKLSGKVRVKVAQTKDEEDGKTRRGLKFSEMPTEIVFTVAGIVVVIAALLLVYYLFM